MITQFKEFFFNLLPPSYFKKYDSYKNSENQGLLERYLNTLGLELDLELVSFIEDFMDILDAEKTPNKFLPFLSGLVGYIPSFNTSPETYRRIISSALAIYQIKGTLRAMELVFNILRYNIFIIEELPLAKITYDNGNTYDHEIAQYDSSCAYCSNYHLVISPIDPVENFEITEDLLNLVKRITSFLQPINAKFAGATAYSIGKTIVTEDGIKYIITENGINIIPD